MTMFNALLPFWLILSLLVPLSAFFLWQEWKRPFRFRTMRMTAVCIMMIMLAAILLRPSFKVEKSGSILLLTQGYDKMIADSLLKVNPDLTVMHTPGVAPYKKSSGLTSYQDLDANGGNIAHVLGQGLPTHALDLMDDKRFDFFPAPIPNGITELLIPQRLVVNRQQTLGGTFNNSSGKKWIYLNGPAGKEDSVILNGNGMKPFSLSFSPRQSGNILYNLTVKDSTGNSAQENIPLHIAASATLNILFIQSYPTFETQYLKNFLTQKKHTLVLRYQLSQNNFRYEYANRSPLQINQLTKAVLTEFDVLIIDKDALQKLSVTERNSIKESIQSGLGLLTILNTPLKKNEKPTDLFPFELTAVTNDTTVIATGSKEIVLPALPIRVVASPSLQPVIKNKSGILAGYTYDGAGKIAFQFLQETFRLTLSGDSVGYSNLWSPLIENIARQHRETATLKITNRFPWYTDEPLHIQIISSPEKQTLFADSVQIPIREDVILDDVWHATVWADDPGWHLLHTANGVSLPYYVSKKNEWKSLSIAEQMKANFITKDNSLKISGEKIVEQKEISPLYFYLLFVLAAGFIWLAPKL